MGSSKKILKIVENIFYKINNEIQLNYKTESSMELKSSIKNEIEIYQNEINELETNLKSIYRS